MKDDVTILETYYSPDHDEIAQWKEEMQKLMPVIQLLQITDPPNTLEGLQRDQRLRIKGYSLEEIEEMTGFKREEYTFETPGKRAEWAEIREYGKEGWEARKEKAREEMLQRVTELQKKNLRKMAYEHRKKTGQSLFAPKRERKVTEVEEVSKLELPLEIVVKTKDIRPQS